MSIQRDVAFQALVGTVSGGVTGEFIGAIDSALYVSLALLGVAGLLSFCEGQREAV
jgi:hypothetical protein